MPDLSEARVIAVACSDIHLCQKAPVARSAEPDWFAVMRRTVKEVMELSIAYDNVPVIIAGDIFDHWKAPPELVNFAIDLFRAFPCDVYAIPGQHDLPFHSMEDIRKSAYWTLVKARAIKHLSPGIPAVVNDKLWLWAFPWNTAVTPRDLEAVRPGSGKAHSDCVHLAVIHAYVWMKGRNYPGAPKAARARSWDARLRGYSAAVFGDNHKGFHVNNVFNCGTLMRRKIDEVEYTPRVALILSDGTMQAYELETAEDLFISVDEALVLAQNVMDMTDLLAELRGLGDTALNFFEHVKRFCEANGIDKQVAQIIEDSMGHKE